MTIRILISLILLLTFSCDDNPVDDHDDDHVEVVGFQILQNDVVLIDHKDNSLAVTDTIFITLNDTAELELAFYDEDGELVNPLEEDEDHDDHGHDDEELELAFRFLENGSELETSEFISIDVHEDDHGHAHSDEPHIELEVSTKKIGITALKVLIMHGDHPDFESTSITVSVK